MGPVTISERVLLADKFIETAQLQERAAPMKQDSMMRRLYRYPWDSIDELKKEETIALLIR